MICDQAGVSPCAPKERFTVPLLGTGKALGIAATSGPERVANASEMRLTPNPRWYAVHIGNNPFPCPCGVISEHSVCATPLCLSARASHECGTQTLNPDLETPDPRPLVIHPTKTQALDPKFARIAQVGCWQV